MIRSASEQMASAIGEELGAADDHIQADLLNGFFGSFYHSMLHASDRDTQIASVVAKLDQPTRRMMERFADFIHPEP